MLTRDASAYGVGAVISLKTLDGQQHPIAFACRTLSCAEQNYSQVEEALSLIYGIRKFHAYLYDQKFNLETDHKPLIAIFGSKIDIHMMGSSTFAKIGYTIISIQLTDHVRPMQEHDNAGGLSRSPLMKGISNAICRTWYFQCVLAELSTCHLHRIENLYINRHGVE